jgi:F420-dependent oxidoreductase-like protein
VKLGLTLGYAPPGTNPAELVPLVQTAEALGYDSVWASEAWGTDAVTVLAWLGASTSRIGSAIMQIPGRTPANTAMTAATLDLMSNGRFILGLGTSGPQVVEGWHGQPWGKPLARTREYVEVVRAALRREVVEHHGEHYRIPYDGAGTSGLGKPLKLMLRPLRPDIPIYLAAIGPKNVALAAEIADGWLPIFVDPERFRDVFAPSLAAARDGFEIAATVNVLVGDDVQALRDSLKPYLALYVGGMGAKGRNFYNALVRRYGWEAEAERIQELYLDG